jgi:hypothetical protein
LCFGAFDQIPEDLETTGFYDMDGMYDAFMLIPDDNVAEIPPAERAALVRERLQLAVKSFPIVYGFLIPEEVEKVSPNGGLVAGETWGMALGHSQTGYSFSQISTKKLRAILASRRNLESWEHVNNIVQLRFAVANCVSKSLRPLVTSWCFTWSK